MDSAEEALQLEGELRQQLQEQKASLAEVDEMLQADPSSEELRQLHAQLLEAVEQLQAGLLDLKKQRMLMELDAMHAAAGGGGAADGGDALEAAGAAGGTAAGAAGTGGSGGGGDYAERSPGGAFSFHFSDGKQHRELEAGGAGGAGGASSAESSGSYSSGEGSSGSSGSGSGSGSESSLGSDDDDDEGHGGLGLGGALAHARAAAEAGPQTETVRFAQWEDHGRGIASKLLSRMGYTAGAGLGKDGEGLVEPLQAELLPKQRGLGHRKHHHHHKHRHHKRGGEGGGEGGEGGEGGGGGGGARKRRQRGGEKSRRRKHAEAARASKQARADGAQAAELAGEAPGLFSFINQSLGQGSEAAGNLRAALGAPQVAVAAGRGQAAAAGAAAGGKPGGGGGGAQGDTRRGLAAHADTIAVIKAKVRQLNEMAARNRADPGLSAQIAARLRDAQAELDAARAAARAAHKSVDRREAERRWVKF